MAGIDDFLKPFGDAARSALVSKDGKTPNVMGATMSFGLAAIGMVLGNFLGGGLGIVLGGLLLGGLGIAAGGMINTDNDSEKFKYASPNQIKVAGSDGITNDLKRMAYQAKDSPVPSSLTDYNPKNLLGNSLKDLEDKAIQIIEKKEPPQSSSNMKDWLIQKHNEFEQISGTTASKKFGMQDDFARIATSMNIDTLEFQNKNLNEKAILVEKYIDSQIVESRKKLNEDFGIGKDFLNVQTYVNTLGMLPGAVINFTGNNPRKYMELALEAFDKGDTKSFKTYAEGMTARALTTDNSINAQHLIFGKNIRDAAEEMNNLNILVSKKEALVKWMVATVDEGKTRLSSIKPEEPQTTEPAISAATAQAIIDSDKSREPSTSSTLQDVTFNDTISSGLTSEAVNKAGLKNVNAASLA